MIRRIVHTFLFIILYSSTIYSQWVQQNPQFITNNHLQSVYFVNELTGYIAGWNGTILKTDDGGINWETQTSGTNDLLSTINFTDDQLGFAGGQEGMILKRDVISSVKQDETFITNYNLSQNYPNPFNPTTSIQYAVNSR